MDFNTASETRGVEVTEQQKVNRASEIADALVNHSKWRSHGRSLKIADLKEYLQINRVDDDPILADIVYRIQTVIKLFFLTTSTYKIFATADEKILRNAVPQGQTRNLPQLNKANIIELDVDCPQCGNKHHLYGKFINDPKIDSDMTLKGKKSLLFGDKLTCSCGFTLDLIGIKNDIENRIGKKFV